MPCPKSTGELQALTDIIFVQKLQFGIFQAEQHLQAEERGIIKRLRKQLGQERSDDEEEAEEEFENVDEQEVEFASLNDQCQKLQQISD